MGRDLGHFRENYEHAALRRSDLAEQPIDQFERWWDEWMGTDHFDASACVLATASADGVPSARNVLCRHFGIEGFDVYTNHESRKGREVGVNPWASLVFGWMSQNRQVRVEGPVTTVPAETADAYWDSRPRGSRLGAWASDQSRVVSDRADLERRFGEAVRRFGADESDGPVPRPPHWGGLRVGVDRMEFWQGRPDRLHDRFEYVRDRIDGTWQINRLAP